MPDTLEYKRNPPREERKDWRGTTGRSRGRSSAAARRHPCVVRATGASMDLEQTHTRTAFWLDIVRLSEESWLRRLQGALNSDVEFMCRPEFRAVATFVERVKSVPGVLAVSLSEEQGDRRVTTWVADAASPARDQIYELESEFLREEADAHTCFRVAWPAADLDEVGSGESVLWARGEREGGS